jgi:hypothetical protein
LPAAVLTERESGLAITSYAVSAEGSPFLIAYYEDDGSGILPGTLHVLRYERDTGRVGRLDLVGAPDGELSGWNHVETRPTERCMGSALDVSEQDRLITITTHINPSAGCTLLLRPDLTFVAELFGGVVGRVKGTLVVEENTVHFAATHPLRLDAFELRTRTLMRLYPEPGDPARREFAAALRSRMPLSSCFAEQNNACDPEQFSGDVVKLTPEPPDGFVVQVRMTGEGFGYDKESTPVKDVRYRFRRLRGRWVGVAAR